MLISQRRFWGTIASKHGQWRGFTCVARGFSNKQIAAELGVSGRTVENHISHILTKKRFSNRVEIARYVFEKG